MFRLLLASALSLVLQPAVDPSGHWEGKLQTPAGSLSVEVDLQKGADGSLVGAVGILEERLKGLPLLEASVKGSTLRFYARRDQPFEGEISSDGKTIAGVLHTTEGDAPFTMTRTGTARIDPPLKSAAIGRALEGTWNASLMARDGEMRLVLRLKNNPDGSATGMLINLDQGGLTIPLVVTHKASAVTLEITVVASSFAGTLNAEGTELVGTISQGTMSAPITFKKVAAY